MKSFADGMQARSVRTLDVFLTALIFALDYVFGEFVLKLLNAD